MGRHRRFNHRDDAALQILELAHIVRRVMPKALIVAGGMEATFRPELMFELGPFDLVVLGEGERPLFGSRGPSAGAPTA